MRLVRFKGRYQVCSITRFGPHRAWTFGSYHEVFCRVGEEEATFELDEKMPTNFFNDPFPFAVDRQSQWQEKAEKVGGMINSSAANAAYEVMQHHEPKTTIVRLRHGSRIIREDQGLGDFIEWITQRSVI